MINHSEEEILSAIREFEDNPYRYENISIESADIAVDCMRSCILQLRKSAATQPAPQWSKYPKQVPPIDGDYLCYYNGFCAVFEFFNGYFYDLGHGSISLAPSEYIWWQDLPTYPKDRVDKEE